MSLVKSNFLNVGNLIAVNPTVNIVITPPKTTALIGPINFAVKPLSKAPSSFDEPTKIELTEPTLPLNSSGVFNCKIVCLIIIETPSVSPYINRANTDSQNMSETPNTIIDIPKQNMAKSNFLPAFLVREYMLRLPSLKPSQLPGLLLKFQNLQNLHLKYLVRKLVVAQ